MSSGLVIDSANDGIRRRFQFGLRTLLLATFLVATGMSCYKSYRYIQEVRRYQGYVRHRFHNEFNEELEMLSENAYSDGGRRLLDEMGASDELRPCSSCCDVIVTVENESPAPIRVYAFVEGRDELRFSPSPICVVTDGSRRLLYWFSLEHVHQHVSANELSLARKGDRYILTLDTILVRGPSGRTILKYTLTGQGVESVERQNDVPITAEWNARMSRKKALPEFGWGELKLRN